jgi:hypothetical protein
VTFDLAGPFFFPVHYRRNGLARKFCICLYQCVSLEISARPLAFSGPLFLFLINPRISNLLNAKDIPIILHKKLT